MKKVLSLLFVLVLVASMTTTAFAKYTVSTGEGSGIGFGELWVESPAANRIAEGEWEVCDDVQPNVTYWFHPISRYTVATAATPTTDLSNWGEAFETDATGSDIEEFHDAWQRGLYPFDAFDDIKLRTRIRDGSQALRDITLMEHEITVLGKEIDAAGIRVRTAQFLKSVNPDGLDFEAWVYPAVDGKVWDYEDYGMLFTGNIVNDFVDIDDGDNYVDLWNHMVAEAETAISDIDYDLGPEDGDHTVIVHGRAANGARYWGRASTSASNPQTAVMVEHGIDITYNLDWIGLDRVAKYVTLDVDPTTYVYDGDLNFLGRGNGEFPLVSTYYVSYNEIVAEAEPAEEFPEEEGLDLPAPPADTGAFGAPEGPFENPSTGC